MSRRCVQVHSVPTQWRSCSCLPDDEAEAQRREGRTPDSVTQRRLRGHLSPSSHFQRDRRQTRQPALGFLPFSSLEVATSKILSRSDLCWPSLAPGHPSSRAPQPTPHLVISLLVCLKGKVFAPPSHSHSVRLRLMESGLQGRQSTDSLGPHPGA